MIEAQPAMARLVKIFIKTITNAAASEKTETSAPSQLIM
jgi:hypothetical protein